MNRGSSGHELRVSWLGRVPYLDAWALQRELAAARSRDEIPDTLLLLEHPHTYTLGSAGKAEHLIWSEPERIARGVAVYRVDRGGDVTYHGPGQLVGYPILKLEAAGPDRHTNVIGYVRMLEAGLIQALAAFDIAAFPYPGLTGVWVGQPPSKIAAIGVKLTAQRITQHGFALNVNTDLTYFGGIIPCGISDKPVTSMERLLGRPIDLTVVTESVASALADTLDRELVIEDVI